VESPGSGDHLDHRVRPYLTRSSWLVLGAYVPVWAHAQRVVTGMVRDTADLRPIASAVVLSLAGDGRVLARTLTDAQGTYRVSTDAAVTRIRVQRLGYRPREVALELEAVAPTVVSLHRVVSLLEPVTSREEGIEGVGA